MKLTTFCFWLLMVATVLASPAMAQTTPTWTGNTSRNWNTPTNWTLGRIPTTTDDVTIPSGPANQPILSITAVANSVEVQTGASLSISSGGSLTLNGSKSVEGITTAFSNGGTVVSGGQLVIGNTASVGLYGLINQGSFSNVAGGQISIDRAISSGLYNLSGSFVNSSTITIGAIASMGTYGLYNAASFSNVAGGQISIDQANNYGLYNLSGSFVNSARLTIGANASVGDFGLYNAASFSNRTGGQIGIDRTNNFGLYNQSESFVNSSTIIIGAIASVGTAGLTNQASFSNAGCSALLRVVSDAIITDQNSGTLGNSGTIIANATGTSNIASNEGLVQNLNGGTFTTGTGPNLPLSLTSTNPTTCNPANGSLTIAGVQANTTFALSYTVGGVVTAVSPPPVSDGSGQFIVGGLGAGFYTLALSGSCVPLPLPLSATLTAPASPSISTQPAMGSAVCVGGAVTTSVSVMGPGPFSYQWYKNGLSLGAAQRASTLSLTAVTAGDAGSYSVVVTGACGSVTSTVFNLTVGSSLPPIANLLQQGTPGNGLTLSATASGRVFVWTGPGGFIYSTVYRTAGIYSASAPGGSSGGYTLTVSDGPCQTSAGIMVR